MRKLSLLLFGVVLMATQAMAQRTITGTVTDVNGLPLGGVSILVKGTTTGTSSRPDGTYTLKLPANAKTLVFTSVDFETMEASIGSLQTINASLKVLDKSMQEVVVTAYGSQKRESITGAISKIGPDQLEGRGVSNVSQALAGAAPGISATSGSGQPGSSAAIRIRGFGSINASSSPLYVVDGFPYEGYIGDLNVNDIESISLLKDASSSALYGARAANGVVVVTTKKGKKPTPKVGLIATTGFSQRGVQEYDRVGTNDYYPIMWQALKNSLVYPVSGTGLSESAAAAQASATIANQLIYNPYNVPNGSIVGVDGKLNPAAQLLYNDFDWYAPLSKNGPRQDLSLNVSAKQDKTDYYASLNYVSDKGFLLKSDFERIAGRISLNTQVKPWLKTGLNISGVLVTTNNAATGTSNTFVNPFNTARSMGPIYPVHAFDNMGNPVLDANGVQYYDYGQHPGAINRPLGASPGRHVIYETILNEDINSRNSMIGRTYVETKFLKDFTFRVNLGLDLNNDRQKRFQNPIVGDGATPNGRASRNSDEYRNVTLNQLLNYNKAFNNHDLAVLLGHESQKVDQTFFSGSRIGQIVEGNLEPVNFVTLENITGSFDKLTREAYFSRINYGYDKKYFVDVSYRRDASSRFAKNSRWGNFYSVGASWFISRESFFSNNGWLSDLKIRAAYGTVGNDALDTYYEYQALYGLGYNNTSEPGAIATKLSNENLTWEVNKTYSLGLDFGLFRNRITGTIELFDRGSSKLLFDVPQGLSSIVTTRTENIGSMSNRGVEIQLNADIIKSKDFKWDVTINATSLKNKIKKLPDGRAIPSGTKRLEEGKDIYAFYLRQWFGVDPSDGSGLYIADPTATTDLRVVKGVTVTTNSSNALYDYSGSAIPKLFGSFTNTFAYRGIGLSFLLNYQVGGKFYDAVYAGLLTPNYGASLHADVLKSWQAPGDNSAIPRFDITSSSRFNAQSNRFLIDASYLNIRNLSISYSLSKNVLDKIKVDQFKFYVSGENLYISSKRKGLNPAESFNGTNSNVYVPNRILSFGINVTF